tara:strand:+ start:295 stop:603 length:309 start_codon:yes stop_codon:yes gene_type:complete
MWDEWLEEYEQVQWKQNGLTGVDYYNGYIKMIGNIGLTVKITSINYVNDWNSKKKHPVVYIPYTEYDKIELEIWTDGRGCDNSAIGVSGNYESYKYYLKEAA